MHYTSVSHPKPQITSPAISCRCRSIAEFRLNLNNLTNEFSFPTATDVHSKRSRTSHSPNAYQADQEDAMVNGIKDCWEISGPRGTWNSYAIPNPECRVKVVYLFKDTYTWVPINLWTSFPKEWMLVVSMIARLKRASWETATIACCKVCSHISPSEKHWPSPRLSTSQSPSNAKKLGGAWDKLQKQPILDLELTKTSHQTRRQVVCNLLFCPFLSHRHHPSHNNCYP